MREILFRGKRLNNGEWVYGFYAHELRGEHYIHADEGAWYDGPMLTMVEVERETVGQDTGLKDKNCKDIFEGDVLHWDFHWGWYVGYENGAFRKIPLSNIQRINWKHYPLEQEGLKTWEVIGNIHDNPELVEVQSEKS